MTLELSYSWHFFSVTTENNNEDFEDLDPVEELDNEYLRIIKKLNCYVPGKGRGSFKKYLRYQQRSLVRLINQLEQQLESNAINDGKKINILEKLLALSEKLIDNLLQNHGRYFDYRELLSQARKFKLEAEINEFKKQVLSSHKNANEQRPLALQFFSAIDGHKKTFHAYRYQISFQRFYLDNIKMLNEQNGLKILLIKTGFNHPGLMTNILEDMKAEILSERSVAAQYKKIISMIKEIKQLTSTGTKLLDKCSRKIKSQIKSFLVSELKFLKELDFITSELVNMDILEAKYKVSLSVKQLAFYVYLNVECGIITEQRAKKIHEYVISHVVTSEKTDISEKSLKNAYYVHAPEDIKRIMEKLGKMLALAQSLY